MPTAYNTGKPCWGQGLGLGPRESQVQEIRISVTPDFIFLFSSNEFLLIKTEPVATPSRECLTFRQ